MRQLLYRLNTLFPVVNFLKCRYRSHYFDVGLHNVPVSHARTILWHSIGCSARPQIDKVSLNSKVRSRVDHPEVRAVSQERQKSQNHQLQQYNKESRNVCRTLCSVNVLVRGALKIFLRRRIPAVLALYFTKGEMFPFFAECQTPLTLRPTETTVQKTNSIGLSAKVLCA